MDNNGLPKDLSFDFLEMLIEKNIETLIIDIRNELIFDCVDMKYLNLTKDLDTTIGYAFSYISKYAYFIYHFEKLEAYEYCAEIRKMFITVICDSFQLDKITIDDLITQSIESYRENINIQ